jgi:hypothetical protein
MQSKNSVVIYSGREIDALNIRSKESHRSVIFPELLPYDLVKSPRSLGLTLWSEVAGIHGLSQPNTREARR